MKKKKMSKRVKTEKKYRLDDTTPFAIRESFNQLRTNIMYMPNDKDGCPVYGITAAGVGVGKSTISSNLSISFAQAGKKVLLIEADMRRPVQPKIFGYRGTNAGLSELLTGIESDDTGVILSPEENLYLITSGCIPPNPSELLHSKRFSQYMDKWKQEYDIIFLDLPPVDAVTDPLAVAHNVNGYIFVIMSGVSSSVCVNKAIGMIEAVGGNIAGVVLNGTRRKSINYKDHYSDNKK